MFIDCKNEQSWLLQRFNYLTASDAANYMGVNPYDPQGKLKLWEEKTGLRKRPDIGNKSAVRFGKQAEEHLRALFMLRHPELSLQYDQYGLYVSDEHPFMAATLDGLLWNEAMKQHEILEIKTGTCHTKEAFDEWQSGELPINYWCQILHQSECVRWAAGIYVFGLISLEWAPEHTHLFEWHFDVRDEEFLKDRATVISAAEDMQMHITTRRRPGVQVTL